MQDGIISLTCPSCGATLKWNEFDVEIKCDYCGTSMIVEKCINDTRINRADKFKVYSKLAYSALSDNYFLRAFYFYDKACKINPSDDILVLRNLTNFLCGNVNFIDSWFDDMKCLPDKERLCLLTKLRNEVLKERRYCYRKVFSRQEGVRVGIFYRIYLFIGSSLEFHRYLKKIKQEIRGMES